MHKKLLQVGGLLDVQIEKLTYGGSGLARYKVDDQNIVIFVPFSAPEDHLKVVIIEAEKNYYIAEIKEIISPSPFRQDPACGSFGSCGGCDWLHLNYEEQVNQKQNILKENLEKIQIDPSKLLPFIQSPQQLYYRNKVQLKFDGRNLGFYAKKTHDVVTSENCILMEKDLFKKHLDLKNQLQGSQKIELFLDEENAPVIRTMENKESIGFSQVNRFINNILIETFLKRLKSYSFVDFYDFYSGSGNFTFPVVDNFKKINTFSVELNEHSVRKAHQLIKSKGLTHSQFYIASVDSYLKRNTIRKNSIVLLDPPRIGCSKYVIDSLYLSEAQSIFYISCNLATLARDLKILMHENRWKVRSVQGFDMFPQTHHIETFVELTR